MDNHNRIKIYVTSYSEEVTGSNNHIMVCWPDGREIAFLADCGLFQEKEHNDKNFKKFIYNPNNISFAIATHTHTDHIGRFPYLIKSGFNGPIYTSFETFAIMPLVLTETAERLDDEYRLNFKNYKQAKDIKKRQKQGISKRGRGKKDRPRREKAKKKDEKRLVAPTLIFDKADIELCMKRVEHKSFEESFSPCEGLEITFYKNAHMGGAVITVCRAFNDDEELTFLLTGDLGLVNPVTNVVTKVPIDVREKVDFIVSEATYGCAENVKNTDRERKKHKEIISDIYNKKGTIMYMSNALERPQRLGADLKTMQQEPDISAQMSNFKIYFDSTFGIKCHNKYTKLYGKDFIPDNFSIIDKKVREQIINSKGPKMIICTSPRLYQGSFLTYGARILEDPNATLVFVAYVPENVRNIINLPRGAEIDFGGERVKLRCKMYNLTYYSSHVSNPELDLFISTFSNVNTILFNHGTNEAKGNNVKRHKTCSNSTHNLLYGRTVLLNKDGIIKYF